VLNPRVRNRRNFQDIVANIARVGLKRPITVSRRTGPDGETSYNLVCGQGRLEAFLELKLSEIPAIVIEADDPDCMVMSLVENCARRHHRAIELMQDIQTLLKRGYDNRTIGAKIGVTPDWVRLVGDLLEKGEQRLIEAVEMGWLPIRLAMEISTVSDTEVQAVLTRAYAEKKLRGKRLVKVRRLLEQRQRQGRRVPGSPFGRRSNPRRPLTTDALLRMYRQEADRQKILIKKAEITQSRLLFIVEALRALRSDESFVNLLRAEGLDAMPRDLHERLLSNVS
jgi:ParB family chromosome partitioning protein